MSALYWKGWGSRHHGEYWITWDWRPDRRSTLYKVFSRKTRQAILTLEVF